MYEHDYQGKQYFLTLYYKGKKIRLRAKQYYSDLALSSWFIFSKTKVLEFTWSNNEKKLTENLIHGQQPVPEDFLELLQKEFENIHLQ